jgi:hypothetical protein
MGELTSAYKISVETPVGKRVRGRHDVDGRTILEMILQKSDVRIWTGFSWLRIMSSGGLLWRL